MESMSEKRLKPLLIVEDEEDHGRLIIKALKEKVHIANAVYWVKNGQSAIDYMRKTGDFNKDNAPVPGLILLDIKLPMLNGFEVLERLKSDPVYKSIPIVMLTTTANSDDVKKALELGANDYIVKPIVFGDFIEKVSSLGHYWAFISDSVVGLPENGG